MIDLPRFGREFAAAAERWTRLGDGPLGGKADGLARSAELLERHAAEFARWGFLVDVPRFVAVGASVYREFVDRHGLADLAASGASDAAIADAFLRAPFPTALVGDLRALAEQLHTPLAARSSSVLEDALGEPFAGVYGTKMVPGDQPDAAARFQSLLEAVKYVWASTLFSSARAYLAATRHRGEREEMAVVLQQVVGRRTGGRFYPDVAGVARSFDVYPAPGARPEDGVLILALGLGKTIVDGEPAWSVSLGRPRGGPPFATLRERVEGTQRRFWAIRVGSSPPHNPMAETEYLVQGELADAELDGTLRRVASTYEAANDRIVAGIGRSGARLVDFAPLLVQEELPLVPLVRQLLAACEEETGSPVEIEFALAIPPTTPPQFGMLQVRPLFVDDREVELAEGDLTPDRAWIGTAIASGNGRRSFVDVVYVDPTRFDRAATRAIAAELGEIDRELSREQLEYLLLGFGRFGSADPWLGIPVRWDQISGARAIVEAGLPGWRPDPSQGSHFFHNLQSFDVLYLAVPPEGSLEALWDRLAAQPVAHRTEHVVHVRLAVPLEVVVDARSRRGAVLREEVA